MKNKIVSILLMSLLAFASCNNPLKKKFKPDSFLKDIEEIDKSKKVSEDESKMIKSYVVLAAFRGKDLVGMTYSEILDEAYKVKDRLKTSN